MAKMRWIRPEWGVMGTIMAVLLAFFLAGTVVALGAWLLLGASENWVGVGMFGGTLAGALALTPLLVRRRDLYFGYAYGFLLVVVLMMVVLPRLMTGAWPMWLVGLDGQRAILVGAITFFGLLFHFSYLQSPGRGFVEQGFWYLVFAAVMSLPFPCL